MHSKAPLSFDGASVSALVGAAAITVIRVRPTAFRVEVAHRGPFGAGPVVDELSQSFPAEATARRVARNLYRAFAAGMTVAQVVAALVAVVDAALDRAFAGGDGTGRRHTAIPALDALREQLRPAGERAERRARLDEMAGFLATTEPLLGQVAVNPPLGGGNRHNACRFEEPPALTTLADIRAWNLANLPQPARRTRRVAA